VIKVELIKKYGYYVAAFIIAIIALLLSFEGSDESPLDAVSNFDEPANIVEEETVYIYVDIKGQVMHPGVYKLKQYARIYEIIEKAGGFTVEADQNTINLSKIMKDQDVVYIPSKAEMYPRVDETTEDSQNLGVININTATKEVLETLPGIGPSTAQSIIDYRENIGLFETIEDIMNVSGIGESTFNDIKDSIKV
jgi:competence protein ComEA